VVDAIIRRLSEHQRMWEKMMDAELVTLTKEVASLKPGAELNMDVNFFQDWVVAVANDQIACIDDDPNGGLSYLSRFMQDVESTVSAPYWEKTLPQFEMLRDGYVDLSTHCLSVFASIMFTVDFRSIFADFFTPAWYTGNIMKNITLTFGDYLKDYRNVLHPSLLDILASELSTRLLIQYLSSIRNKNVKFRRQDPFEAQFRLEINLVWEEFKEYSTIEVIRDEWRALSALVDLLAVEKTGLPDVYQALKQQYWDLNIGWVEAVLKCRDDYQREMINAVKKRAAEMEVEMGPETVMGRVNWK